MSEVRFPPDDNFIGPLHITQRRIPDAPVKTAPDVKRIPLTPTGWSGDRLMFRPLALHRGVP